MAIKKRIVMGRGCDPFTNRLRQASIQMNPILSKASVGVWSDGHLRFYSIGTLRNGGCAVEVDEHTVWDIASITKSFLTILTLVLIERIGKFSLDTKVAEVLGMKGSYVSDLEVRHLLQFNGTFNGGHPTQDRLALNGGSFSGLVNEICENGLADAPGTKFKYSNVHSILLGIFIERMLNASLEVLMKKYVIDPLGMQSTCCRPAHMLNRVVVSEKGVGLGMINDPVARSALAGGRMIGAAGLFSTSHDLLCLMGFIMKGGVSPDGERLLSETCVRSLHQGMHPGFGNGFGRWNVFMENLVEFPDDPEGVHKTGHTGGFVAALRSHNVAVAVLTNFLAMPRAREAIKGDRDRLNQLCADLVALAVERRFDTGN